MLFREQEWQEFKTYLNHKAEPASNRRRELKDPEVSDAAMEEGVKINVAMITQATIRYVGVARQSEHD